MLYAPYPVHLQFLRGESVAHFEATSENVSSGGILVRSPWEISPNTDVTLVMRISGEHFVPPIRLATEGTTVRSEKDAAEASFLIAVQFKNPVTELKLKINYLLLEFRSQPLDWRATL